jgi:hypothetical protein
LGEQLGDEGVRFTTSGFAPSVRICNDSVLGETYFGVIRPLFTFGVIPIAKVTAAFAPLVEGIDAADCADARPRNWSGVAALSPPPLPQPATAAEKNANAIPQLTRFGNVLIGYVALFSHNSNRLG